jgi:transcriptional regulator with XRE-family HTH domain
MNGIGDRIKLLRTERGMTLAELGAQVNLSTSYLSQIERDRTTPSLATLTSIAKALDVRLRYFFETEADTAVIIRADVQPSAEPIASPIHRQRLTPEKGDNKIETYQVTFSSRTLLTPLMPHPGEEFCFVLSGTLTMTIGDERYALAAGDSIHYDAQQPHAWGNESAEPCNVIWSHSMPRSERLATETHPLSGDTAMIHGQ